MKALPLTELKPIPRPINNAITSPGVGGGVAPEFPVDPKFAIYSIDHLDSDGRVVANRYSANEPDKNILSLTSGYIEKAAGAGVFTNAYATGPGGQQTAVRFVCANDTVSALLYSGAPPAGSYTLRFKAKNNAVGTVDLRYGNTTAGLQTVTLNDATWTTVTYSFTASGANYAGYMLTPAVGSSLDILMDEIQWYNDADGAIPDYADEVNDWHLRAQYKGYPGGLTRSGNLLDNASGGATGVVKAPSFPLATTYSEVTAMVALKMEDATALSAAWVTEADTTIGTTVNSLQLGFTATGGFSPQPISAGTCKVNVNQQGWHIFAVRIKAGSRQSFFHEIELNTASSAFAGLPVRFFNLGGAGTMKGKFGIWAFWDSWLSDDDLAASVAKLRADVAAMGETMGTFDTFYIAEGDSRTAFSTSYAMLMGDVGEFTPNLYLRDFAVSGSGAATLTARLSAVQRVVDQAKLNGRQVVLSVLIGVNDSSTIVSGGAAAYYNNTLKPLWAAYRAMGVKLIACTELTDNGNTAGYEAARVALNTLIRSDASLYDALADFGADPVMGTATSQADTPANWTDAIHPSSAGHVVLKPIFKAALATLL